MSELKRVLPFLVVATLITTPFPPGIIAGPHEARSEDAASGSPVIHQTVDGFTLTGIPREGGGVDEVVQPDLCGIAVQAGIIAVADYSCDHPAADADWPLVSGAFINGFMASYIELIAQMRTALIGVPGTEEIRQWIASVLTTPGFTDGFAQVAFDQLSNSDAIRIRFEALSAARRESPDALLGVFGTLGGPLADLIDQYCIAHGVSPFPDNSLPESYYVSQSFASGWKNGEFVLRKRFAGYEQITLSMSITTLSTQEIDLSIGLLNQQDHYMMLGRQVITLPPGNWFLYSASPVNASYIQNYTQPPPGYAFGCWTTNGHAVRHLLDYSDHDRIRTFTIQDEAITGTEKLFRLGDTDQFITMIWIDPGIFWMGAQPNELGADSSEYPRHQVYISHGFWIAKYELMQEQWEAVTGYNPSEYLGPTHPVTQMTWEGIHEDFLAAINQSETGDPWRLPTEAEWEYVARAGCDTLRFWWGDDPGYTRLDEFAWYLENIQPIGTKAVGQKRPNPWGLYDVLGNAWERCSDWFGSNYYANSPAVDPQGPWNGTLRVVRGGCWHNSPERCRLANRGTPNFQGNQDIGGIRLLREE